MLEALAHVIDGTRDLDTIAALAAQIQTFGPMPSPEADDELLALQTWATDSADAACVYDCRMVLDRALEDHPAPVGWTAAVLLLERVLRATLAARAGQLEDPDAVRTAADVLEQDVRRMLVRVSVGHISAVTYRVM